MYILYKAKQSLIITVEVLTSVSCQQRARWRGAPIVAQ